MSDYESSSSESEDNARNIQLAPPSSSTTPIPSRSPSPLPEYLHPYTDDSEPNEPFLRSRAPWWREDRRRWWNIHTQRRRKRDGKILRLVKKWTRPLVRHPFFPRQPLTVILTLILFSGFAIFLTLLLMYILNPDKEPLPWRAYCSIPSMAAPPEPPGFLQSRSTHPSYHPFPPDNLDTLPPAGLFIGVFSVDSAFERRALVRSTWASHPRSRNGANDGDMGAGTSRTIVRFILGQPRKDWERRVRLEMDTYHDIIILPIAENMNSGKTHTFFSWASINAWVPPSNETTPSVFFSYSNYSTPPPPFASHDPAPISQSKPWVRPDYVVKVDDDAFVMLAELESRLRVELHQPPRNPYLSTTTSYSDPLIYWGYLVTSRYRFMAGELYALTWSLVDWVAKDPTVKGLTRGAEDKQTAKWMLLHPRASEIRWTSERCWIYDHPRSGTVYAHGFLFPSEATRVRRELEYPDLHNASAINTTPTPASWAHSSVSTFGVRYAPPLPDLTTMQSVEALVEGSNMSFIRDAAGSMTPEYAWDHREGRTSRYEGRRVGGTTVIHFIKKNMWFLETAIAMLDGEDLTLLESLKSQLKT